MMRGRQVELWNASIVNILKSVDEKRIFIFVVLLVAMVAN